MTVAKDINNVGMTAFFIAHFRDAEGNRPDSLFCDPCSRYFVPDEVRPFAQRFAELCPGFETLIRCRLLLFRELVRREIAAGTRQIVSVGAGFDTRPITFATEGVAFFDVDQPAVIEYKRRTLRERGIASWPAIRCDYLDVNLPERLADIGFDPNEPSLFIWEGNTMYLPLDLIHDFLSRLRAQVPNMTLAFDYLSEKVINRTSGDERISEFTDLFESNFGVKWVTGFDDLSVLTEKHGLEVVKSESLLEVGERRAPESAAAIEEFMDVTADLLKLYSYSVFRAA